MRGVRWSSEELAAWEARHVPAHLLQRRPAPARARPSPARQAARRERPEDDLQRDVAEYLDGALLPPTRWLHIPNEGKRSRRAGARLKSFGMKAGAADVLILPPFRWVWIELKSGEGFLSAAQKGWRDWCHDIGAPWYLCRSLDDVVAACVDAEIELRAGWS